jgi:hypothetical protein
LVEIDEDDNVREITPDEDDPEYNTPMGTSLGDEVIEDPAAYYEPDVETAEGVLSSHAGTLVPWVGYPTDTIQVHAAATAPITTPVVFRHRATRKANPGEQPQRGMLGRPTLNGYIKVFNVKAHVLIDTGCTTDMISPAFLAVINQVPFELDEPVGLLLATTGSKSKINYGYNARLQLGKFQASHYLDVANLDQYDLILGTPFLRTNKAIISFDGPASISFGNERHIEGVGEFGTSRERGGKPTEKSVKQLKPTANPSESAAIAVLKSE